MLDIPPQKTINAPNQPACQVISVQAHGVANFDLRLGHGFFAPITTRKNQLRQVQGLVAAAIFENLIGTGIQYRVTLLEAGQAIYRQVIPSASIVGLGAGFRLRIGCGIQGGRLYAAGSQVGRAEIGPRLNACGNSADVQCTTSRIKVSLQRMRQNVRVNAVEGQR